ncbi:hypothetical protein C8D03_0392 [Bosea sp. 124]|nr:hypothetical protein C8D03_0392 [Bosea sp. 124]
MAYILRSLAVIGVIALNSPVQSEKPDDGGAVARVRSVARAAAQVDPQSAMSSVTAARETAQILAGLDPETRQRVMALATAGLAGRHDPREPSAPAATR